MKRFFLTLLAFSFAVASAPAITAWQHETPPDRQSVLSEDSALDEEVLAELADCRDREGGAEPRLQFCHEIH